jgi:3-oxoacyl-[acyl-carrier protein] reductase
VKRRPQLTPIVSWITLSVSQPVRGAEQGCCVGGSVRIVARFRDRVAIVTGAGAPSGIGAAVARDFVAEGGRVVLGATSERVHERAVELGDAAVGVVADLTVDGAADSLVRTALDRWGRLDVLVNNAGMTSVSTGWDADGDVAELSLADWDSALARNLTTAFLMCRSGVPVMRSAGYGRIVSVGSTTGTVNAMPGQSTYTAAKAGLVGLSRALALEVVQSGITVNVVAPGYISTGSQLPFEAEAAAAGPIGRSGTPAEIAACVLFLAHESASFVTGAVLVADGGHGLPETWPRP